MMWLLFCKNNTRTAEYSFCHGCIRWPFMPVKLGKAQSRYEKLYVFHQQNLREKIIGVAWKDKVTNTEVLKRTGHKRLHDTVKEKKIGFAGHVIRMAPERPAMHWIPADEKRKRGRPRKTRRSTFQENMCKRCQPRWSGDDSGRPCTLAKTTVRCSAKDRRN